MRSFLLFIQAQLTPTSSLWLQLLTPIPACGQSKMLLSFPVHLISSSQMRPVPAADTEHCESILETIACKPLNH